MIEDKNIPSHCDSGFSGEQSSECQEFARHGRICNFVDPNLRDSSQRHLFSKCVQTLIICTWCCIVCVCTKSPFGDDDLGGSNVAGALRNIQGNVSLNDGSDPENVYVWMEVFEISNYTDEKGHFSLTLPNKANYGGSEGISGFYDVYFYIANYILDSAQVIVNENEFLYGAGDISTDGSLSPLVMRKYVDIKTTLDPPTISTDYDTVITVNIELKAKIDFALVHFPGATFLSGLIFVKNRDSNDYYSYWASLMMHLPYWSEDWIAVEKERPAKITMQFTLKNQPLQTGRYEIIPYFFTFHDRFQEDFMEKVFPNSSSLDSNFFNIPMKREGGYLEVNE